MIDDSSSYDWAKNAGDRKNGRNDPHVWSHLLIWNHVRSYNHDHRVNSRCAEALKCATYDELYHGLGDSTYDRENGENQQRQQYHRFAAEYIAELGIDDQEASVR